MDSIQYLGILNGWEGEKSELAPSKMQKKTTNEIYDRGQAAECEKETENEAIANRVCVCVVGICAIYDGGATKRNDSKTYSTHIRKRIHTARYVYISIYLVQCGIIIITIIIIITA